MDVHSPEQRSFNMSRIRGKDTGPEMIVRRWFWKNGYRYRLHRKDLPGKPDIILPKYHAVLFVHGCFWHRHGCKATTAPSTNQEFWLKKFNDTITRDNQNIQTLIENGWRVAIVWECVLKNKNTFQDSVTKNITEWLHSNTKFMSIPNSP
jgi:DNA mismatch endonuclease, patch repair protein